MLQKEEEPEKSKRKTHLNDPRRGKSLITITLEVLQRKNKIIYWIIFVRT